MVDVCGGGGELGQVRVHVFPTRDAEGAELLAQIERALAPVVRPLELKAVWSPAQSALIRSILTADVTVLDLTPGPEGDHRCILRNFPWVNG